jgi:hypothetical protein
MQCSAAQQYKDTQCSAVQHYSHYPVQCSVRPKVPAAAALHLSTCSAPATACPTLHCPCTALHCTALHCTALHCTYYTALHCTARRCTALHGTAECEWWREWRRLNGG